MKTARSNDPLVAFLYLLMRDRVQPGVVEKLMDDLEGSPLYVFTNGYLAAHAEDIAKRLRP